MSHPRPAGLNSAGKRLGASPPQRRLSRSSQWKFPQSHPHPPVPGGPSRPGRFQGDPGEGAPGRKFQPHNSFPITAKRTQESGFLCCHPPSHPLFLWYGPPLHTGPAASYISNASFSFSHGCHIVKIEKVVSFHLTMQ